MVHAFLWDREPARAGTVLLTKQQVLRDPVVREMDVGIGGERARVLRTLAWKASSEPSHILSWHLPTEQ